MRRLAKHQIEHLTWRIEGILDKLANREIAKLGTPPQLITYSNSEMLAIIRSGKAKLRKGASSHYARRLCDSFVFPETAAMKKAKTERERYDKAINAIRARYEAEKHRLRDQAILGDSVEAMRMVQALELRLKEKTASAQHKGDK